MGVEKYNGLYRAKSVDNAKKGEWVYGWQPITTQDGTCWLMEGVDKARADCDMRIKMTKIDPDTKGVCICRTVSATPGIEWPRLLVFDGDMIECEIKTSRLGTRKHRIGVVRRDRPDGEAYWCDLSGKEPISYDYAMMSSHSYKIVGNIYDNPELLEVKA